MSLLAVRDAVRVLLASVPEAGVVDPGIPSSLGNDVTTIVYQVPGDVAAGDHRGRGGMPLFRCRDVVAVEWHYLVQEDDLDRGDALALPALDAFRTAIWSGMLWDRVGGTVEQLHGIGSDYYGLMTFGAQPTFGFRLLIDLTHATPVTRAFAPAAATETTDVVPPAPEQEEKPSGYAAAVRLFFAGH